MSVSPMYSTPDFFLSQGDTIGSIRSVLTDANGSAVDLPTGTTVLFRMRSVDHEEVLILSAAEIEEPLIPGDPQVVRYDWQAGDSDEPGDFHADWVVTFPSTAQQTFPNNGWIWVRIKDGGVTG